MGQRGTLKIESGSWRGFYSTYEVDRTTGKKKRRQKSTLLGPKSLGKFEAYKLLAAEIERALGGTDGAVRHRPSATVTLEQYTRSRWLPTKEANWRSHRDSKGREVNPGKSSAEETLRHIFKAFGTIQLGRLDSAAMQRWLNGMAAETSDSVTKHCRYYLKAILKFAVWEDYLRKNPAEYLALPTTKTVDKSVLTPGQFSAVIAELDDKHSLLVRTGVFCAFRPSELLALRWRDFDSEKRVFLIRETLVRGVLRPFTKTTDQGSAEKHILTVAIPDALGEELVRYRGPQDHGHFTTLHRSDADFIFCTYKGTPLHKENVLQRVFEPVRKELKLDALNFQVLRRTMATLSQHAGRVKDIQSVLRHKSPDVTAGEYMQVIPESARRMVNDVYAELVKDEGRAVNDAPCRC